MAFFQKLQQVLKGLKVPKKYWVSHTAITQQRVNPLTIIDSKSSPNYEFTEKFSVAAGGGQQSGTVPTLIST